MKAIEINSHSFQMTKKIFLILLLVAITTIIAIRSKEQKIPTDNSVSTTKIN
jgi:hypothetical protein